MVIALAERKTETIGEYLKRRRAEEGMAVRALAAAAGISATYVSAIENGRMVPSVSVAERIARALGDDAKRVVAMSVEPMFRYGKFDRITKSQPYEASVLLSFVPVGRFSDEKVGAARGLMEWVGQQLDRGNGDSPDSIAWVQALASIARAVDDTFVNAGYTRQLGTLRAAIAMLQTIQDDPDDEGMRSAIELLRRAIDRPEAPETDDA